MSFIAVNAEKNIVAFSVTDNIALSIGEQLKEIPDNKLPGQMRFCRYEEGQVIVDTALRDETLQKETDLKNDIENAKKVIIDKYKGKNKSEISDSDAIEYIKLGIAQKMGLEL